ncbi:MAG: F0F1 ATP synthase subunit A [Endomicrobium sp.]|jgi:F-type H+-transporting ATPase subunit a|nr:F0F1 ATP synthase subunit A [Endomicrobium sp.]
MHISPDLLFTIADFPITNTVVTTLITDIILIILVLIVGKSVALKPGKVQNIIEAISDFFRKTTENIDEKRASFIYPWVLSFFLFIVISNLVPQVPGFESIRFYTFFSGHHGVALFRAATSDLNLTLALAVTSVVATHCLSIKQTGIKSYVMRFITFKMFPVFLFVGILEFVNEFPKFISFSFRLFGNIFAGENVIATMYSLCPLVLPLPFIGLELMIAIIQAIVFAMLTMTSMHIMTDKHTK